MDILHLLYWINKGTWSKFLLEILVSQETSYLSKTHDKIHNWTIVRLEDINENVSGYGDHN